MKVTYSVRKWDDSSSSYVAGESYSVDVNSLWDLYSIAKHLEGIDERGDELFNTPTLAQIIETLNDHEHLKSCLSEVNVERALQNITQDREGEPTKIAGIFAAVLNRIVTHLSEEKKQEIIDVLATHWERLVQQRTQQSEQELRERQETSFDTRTERAIRLSDTLSLFAERKGDLFTLLKGYPEPRRDPVDPGAAPGGGRRGASS